MKLPPLKALPVFLAVARRNSFSLAAEELAVTQSAVSHQIKLLENYLGEALFIRTGRYLQITQQGRQYAEVVGSTLRQLEQASEQLRGHERAQLRLSVFSSFAVRWLVPRLPGLQQSCPQLDLALEMSSEVPELSDRIADCFITVRPDSTAYSYELLYTERLFPVCSQRFWQQICQQCGLDPLSATVNAEAMRADSLVDFPLLSTHSIYNRPAGDWQAWYAAAGLGVPARARLQHFSHMLLALEAARYHQGIALTNDYMLSTRADSADFVRLPTHHVVTGDVFYFAWKSSRQQEASIQLLRRWLRQEAIDSGLRSHALT